MMRDVTIHPAYNHMNHYDDVDIPDIKAINGESDHTISY
jgi:hypothetical protein